MQESTRLVLLRHGQTAWNAEQRIQGQLDVPLDATGEWQAQRVAKGLAHEDFAAMYSSDLLRTQQTAAPLTLINGLKVGLDTGLRERGFGSFEGQTYQDIDMRWPEHARRWRERDVHYQPGGGEDLLSFNERSVSTVLKLAAAHVGQTIAVFTHGGVLDCVYRHALGLALTAPRSWQINNAVIHRMLWTPQGLTLVGWNDSAHLEGQPST
jgi:2,3-bisphosphoglycerate-dependent phosphoglycerate mutase